MRKILRWLKNYYIRRIDASYPREGKLNESGGAYVTFFPKNIQNEVFPKLHNFRDKLMNSPSFVGFLKENQGKGFFFNDLLAVCPDAAKLLTDDILLSVRQYLGEGAKLDIVNLFSIYTEGKSDERSSSGILHHDSVGSRVKIFFSINKDGNIAAPTEYILNMHKQFYQEYENPVGLDGKRLSDDLLAKHGSSLTKFKEPFGTALVFDTNGVHRGVYDEGEVIRLNILFELSCKKAPLVRGYVGPREFDLAENAYESLRKTKILRDRLIRKSGNVYRQSSVRTFDNESVKIQDFKI